MPRPGVLGQHVERVQPAWSGLAPGVEVGVRHDVAVPLRDPDLAPTRSGRGPSARCPSASWTDGGIGRGRPGRAGAPR